MKNLVIIGGGPAALMLASQLDQDMYSIKLYEKKKAVGRKFLVAGEGGLNLTYNDTVENLASQYFPSEFMAPIINKFSNVDLVSWFNDLGISTFIGSSNRVFPDFKFKPIEVLNKIVKSISANGIEILLEKNWIGWDEQGQLCFEDFEIVKSDIIVFALGGASWKVTGSDGKWSNIFEERGVIVKPFRAANCAFSVDWDKNFIAAHEGKPLKNIALSYNGHVSNGELAITNFGIEGNAIYGLSQKLQEGLVTEKNTVVYLDLKPTMTADQIKAKLKNSQLIKATEILKKDLNLDRACIGLLKQFSDKDSFLKIDLLAKTIKAVPIIISTGDELDKAISSLGGIALEEIDKNFQFKKIPNAYAIGEMLDWFAPTGGYLLQGCFSMGFVLAEYLNNLEHE